MLNFYNPEFNQLKCKQLFTFSEPFRGQMKNKNDSLLKNNKNINNISRNVLIRIRFDFFNIEKEINGREESGLEFSLD